MNNVNLQKAIDSLEISDLYVIKLVADCSESFDPKHSNIESLTIQTKHLVSGSEIVGTQDDIKLFRVFVETGIRWVDESKGAEKESAAAWIEAKFVSEYNITDDVENDCLDQFALKNVSYHVWPYWRELLTSQCDRMRLPRVMLPTVQFANNKNSIQSENNE
ncbi:MAG: hypothetical protein MJK04_00400 [Psychrosphaera sp.]|nr:hypothetical protein [Psychrosphaera sp.]